jgi:fatty acid desaturase
MAALQKLFRYTPYDALPAACAVANVGLILGTFLGFHILPTWLLAVMFGAIVFAYCVNVQSIAHNFIHNAFFTSPWLNRAFSVVESLAIGIPQTIYHHYHLNHHFGDNDAQGPDGTTKDWGSTYRHGQNGKTEPLWSYCLIGFFRFEIGPCLRMIVRNGRRHVLLCLAESVALGAFWLTMLLVDWRYLLYFYVPSYYLGWVLIYAHTYFLHYGAEPGNLYANSVSSYHQPYNWIFFNNGFHQEHHWDPKAHWTQMKAVREDIRPQMIANHTRILRGPHITVMIEDWWRGQGPNRSSAQRTATKIAA